jgi:uncharacterized protein with HEPN domain
MRPEAIPLLQDILESATIIKQYISRCHRLYAFVSDTMLVDAVERRLSIIGEALFKANKYDNSLPITDKAKIIGLRHILVHEYDRLEKNRIWLLCHAPLDFLMEEVQQLLQGSLLHGME